MSNREQQSDLMALVSRRRTFTVVAVPLVMLALAQPTLVSLIAGCVLVAAGQALRLWAAGYIHKESEVTTGGPYAYVRNPLYVGSFLISAGFAVMSAVWISWLLVAVQYAFVYHLTVIAEEQRLEEILGESYRQYRASVPRWIPSLRPYPYRSGRFDFRQVGVNKELSSMMVVDLACLLFILKMLCLR
ncbi:MAG: methyltransferase family protein [Armatimonadota bacterium]